MITNGQLVNEAIAASGATRQTWLREGVQVVTEQAGRIVVPVNALVGVNRPPEEYRWLREHFTPVDHIAYSYLVYDVPKEMLPQGGGDSKRPKELPPRTR